MNVKLTDKDKIRVCSPDDLYGIMQRILLRENKIDREKEHLWMVGLNLDGVILYIELVCLGSVKNTIVEPMNVFRVAILKGAVRVIIVHNHPSGGMQVSDQDKECTDRLIQVGKIIDISVDDHLIISPITYVSFRVMGLMDELENSARYVPTYQLIYKIRTEEQALKKEAVKAERNLRMEEKKRRVEAEKQRLEERLTVINNLSEKNMTIDEIATILNVTTKEVEKILKKKK